MAKSEEKSGELALADYPVLSAGSSAQMEAVTANLGEEGIQSFDLDRVSIPAGGGTQWLVPSLEGEESVKEIQGIIVAWRSPRVYWEVSVAEMDEPSPPDCSSPDGRYGTGRFGPGSVDNPVGACSSCPLNQWGSAGEGSKAKACKEQRHLYVIRPGGVLPMVVTLPPTSINPMRQYFLRLASESLPYYGVVTSLGLEAQSSGAYRWSTVKPRLVERLDAPAAEASKAYGEQLSANLPASSSIAPSGAIPDGASF